MSAEETQALRRIKVCDRCEDEHIRAYPTDPDRVCEVVGCECWCRL